jgi:hypothetical protein
MIFRLKRDKLVLGLADKSQAFLSSSAAAGGEASTQLLVYPFK